jgi:hypothetical protein
MTVGALLTHESGACAAMALVAAPGPSPQLIVPWGGKVTVHNETVEFREYPESQITVNDFYPCASLSEELEKNRAAVVKAIQEAPAEAPQGASEAEATDQEP